MNMLKLKVVQMMNLAFNWIENIAGNGAAFQSFPRVPRDPVVKCLTHNPGVLGSSRTESSGFFRRSVLG